jgi:hypothetical protein
LDKCPEPGFGQFWTIWTLDILSGFAKMESAFKKGGSKMPATVEVEVREAPVETQLPEKELRLLEEEALRRGMSPERLEEIRAFGECPSQIQSRIESLRHWILTHPY